MANFVCVRYEPIRNQADAGRRSAHGRRSGGHDLTHCDPGRRSLVLAGGVRGLDAAGPSSAPFDIGRCLNAATEAGGLRRRQRAAIGAELIFIATPHYFELTPYSDSLPADDHSVRSSDADGAVAGGARVRQGALNAIRPAPCQAESADQDRDELRRAFRELLSDRFETAFLTDADNTSETTDLPRGLVGRCAAVMERADGSTRETLAKFDPRRVLDFLATVLVGCSKRRDWTVACWRLDLDETTPHLSVFIIPSYQKHTKRASSECVSVREAFGQPAKLRALQDWAGLICAPLGLVRGRPRTETNARNLSPRKYRAIKTAEEAAAKQKQEADEDRKAAAEERAKAEAACDEFKRRLLAEHNRRLADLDRLKDEVELEKKRLAKEKRRIGIRIASVETAVDIAATVIKGTPSFEGRRELLAALAEGKALTASALALDFERALDRWRDVALSNAVERACRLGSKPQLHEMLPAFGQHTVE